MKRLLVCSLALTAIVGLALPALGDDARPLKGHADEVITSAQQVGDELLVTATGQGQATHLGQFTRLANVVISLVDGSAKGTVVFTAANGDDLFVEIDAVPTGSPTTVAGTYTFTGGTGRFNGASGTAEFAGAFASDGIHISVAFEGTLQY